MNKVIVLLCVLIFSSISVNAIMTDEFIDETLKDIDCPKPEINVNYNYESFERIPIKLQILEPISTKKNNITDGQKIKFKVKQNVKHNHHVILTAGTIVEGTVETFMPRGMNGIPGVIILDDFEIPGLEKSKLKSTYIKRGPDLSLCVFPLKWALTFLPPTGSLTNFIVGGNAKISTKDTIQVFYYPAWN